MTENLMIMPKRKKSEQRKTYKDYIKSVAWKSKRSKRIFMDKGQCQCVVGKGEAKCGSRHKLEVHHLTYVRFGNELMTDLITLCHKHHVEIHKKSA